MYKAKIKRCSCCTLGTSRLALDILVDPIYSQSTPPLLFQKLDVITNDLLKRALRFTGRLGVLASEEEDVPVDLLRSGLHNRGSEILIEEGEKYVAVFDPLDGSPNVDAGIPTGTIIGVYEHDESCNINLECTPEECTEQEAQCLANTLQPGTNLVAAAYCLYSSSTFFALTLGNGVYIFTLDETIGEFILSKPSVQIPESSSIYSFNEAKLEMWDEPMRKTVNSWREGTGKSGKIFSSRYIGSMVGDVHRTLLYGGVFGYPASFACYTKQPQCLSSWSRRVVSLLLVCSVSWKFSL